ncbi:MAG: DUF6512 family protein [bacterium]|nr:DUF6512 family protein [bacterium]
MNLKKIKIISSIGIFILAFIIHFVYELIPCCITAIFAPVNESIWEHQKLLFTSVIFEGIIDYIILNKSNVKYNNFFTSLFISAISIIPIFLILYLPLYFKIGPKMYLNIGIMTISIIISQIISYFILKSKNSCLANKISIILIIVCYIILGYLTYNPIKNKIFFDTKDEKYGINNYNI